MNWNDCETIWKRQELPHGTDAELDPLRQTFETKSRKLAATLLLRDGLEAGAGLFVIVAMSLVWWQQGRAGWPIAFAIALLLGVTLFFVRERLRAHRHRLGPDAALLAKLDADLAELRHQRRLLLGVWKWYLAPIAAAIVIVCLTVALNRPPGDLARNPIFLGGYLLFVAVFLWAVGRLNLRAVHRQIEPRLLELEKLRSDLLAP